MEIQNAVLLATCVCLFENMQSHVMNNHPCTVREMARKNSRQGSDVGSMSTSGGGGDGATHDTTKMVMGTEPYMPAGIHLG